LGIFDVLAWLKVKYLGRRGVFTPDGLSIGADAEVTPSASLFIGENVTPAGRAPPY
jgi:hypothetical protein